MEHKAIVRVPNSLNNFVSIGTNSREDGRFFTIFSLREDNSTPSYELKKSVLARKRFERLDQEERIFTLLCILDDHLYENVDVLDESVTDLFSHPFYYFNNE